MGVVTFGPWMVESSFFGRGQGEGMPYFAVAQRPRGSGLVKDHR